MKTVIIYDTETTGLDPAKDHVIEVGAVLFSVEHATVLECFSGLIRAEDNAAEAVNAIPVATLLVAPPAPVVWDRYAGLLEKADAVVAHHAEFDRGFTPAHLRDRKPWICSKADLAWPRPSSSTSLVAIALAHGVGISSAHRALTDCLILARLFERVAEMGMALDPFLARGLRPKAKFRAVVSYDDREKAKAAGFQWDGTTKTWWRQMAIEDASALPFRVERMS